MARVEWIEARLQRWARWQCGRSADYAAVSPDSAGMPRDAPTARRSQTMPGAEAIATGVAIEQLPSPLREAVVQVYLRSGTLREAQHALGCAERTLHARIERAHSKLAAHFAGRGRGGFYGAQ